MLCFNGFNKWVLFRCFLCLLHPSVIFQSISPDCHHYSTASVYCGVDSIAVDESGHIEVVRLLLQDPRVNPAAGNNSAISGASKNGHVEVVKFLLQDPRVDPRANDNCAILAASGKGYAKVVQLLLHDGRADPDWAVVCASQYGHSEVVKLLLQDNRVNPAVCDNYALKLASKNSHADVVRVLLGDPRVVATTIYTTVYRASSLYVTLLTGLI